MAAYNDFGKKSNGFEVRYKLTLKSFLVPERNWSYPGFLFC